MGFAKWGATWGLGVGERRAWRKGQGCVEGCVCVGCAIHPVSSSEREREEEEEEEEEEG